MLVREALLAGRFLRLAHDLHPGALCSHIVEAEIGTRRALVVDSGTDTDLIVLLVFASLEATIIFDEVTEIVVGVELVGVGVWLVALSQLLNGSAADLKVLLIRIRAIAMRSMQLSIRWGSGEPPPLRR